MFKIIICLWLFIYQYGRAQNWHSLTDNNNPFLIKSSTKTSLTINKVIHLKHITTQYAMKQLQKTLLQKITILPIRNQRTLWLQGDQHQASTITKLIQLIDHATPQIKIRARIITVDQRYLRSLGLTFKTTTSNNENKLESSTKEGTAIVTLARLGNNKLLDVEINALQKQGHARILAEPTLITNNNQAAIIESGEEVPYQQKSSSGATNVSFKKAVLRLSVTPELVNKQQILCHIDIHQDKVTPIDVQGVPIINTQHIKTIARITSKHTLVLGGILNQNNERHVEGIPGLSQIPLLGNLFKRTRIQQTEQQLLIFVSPTIIK